MTSPTKQPSLIFSLQPGDCAVCVLGIPGECYCDDLLATPSACAAGSVGAEPADSALRNPGPWRVGLFWSSSNPNQKVRCLAEGADQIAEYEKRGDFLQWIATPAPSVPLGGGEVPRSQYPDADGHNNDGIGEGGEARFSDSYIRAYVEEARGFLEEAYGFAAMSPRGQENINAALALLDDIDAALNLAPARSLQAQDAAPVGRVHVMKGFDHTCQPVISVSWHKPVKDGDKLYLAPAPAGVQGDAAWDGEDALHIPFRLLSAELPELVDFSSSYGGIWSSDWCVTLSDNGTPSLSRFSVSQSKKDAIDAGEFSRYRLWEQSGGRCPVIAWAYQKDVANAINAAHATQGIET